MNEARLDPAAQTGAPLQAEMPVTIDPAAHDSPATAGPLEDACLSENVFERSVLGALRSVEGLWRPCAGFPLVSAGGLVFVFRAACKGIFIGFEKARLHPLERFALLVKKQRPVPRSWHGRLDRSL